MSGEMRIDRPRDINADLLAALQHEVDTCANCDGKGRYEVHASGEPSNAAVVTSQRCAAARAAIAKAAS